MPPIEKFSPQDVDYHETLVPIVDQVVNDTILRTQEVLSVNSGEDEQTLEQYRIYTIGGHKEYAHAVVLIGNDSSRSSRIEDVGTPIRPHTIIAGENFMNFVKAKLKTASDTPK